MSRFSPRPEITSDPSSAFDDDDAALVARIRCGDPEAVRVVWTRTQHRLVRFATRYVHSADVAADLVQSVFLTLWTQRESLAPRTSLESHLFGAVRFQALRTLKHERVVAQHELQVMAQHGGRPAAVAHAGALRVDFEETSALVREIVAGLTPRVREIFLMHREDGLTPAQIASVLGITTPVVYNQLAKAVKALATGLEPHLHDEQGRRPGR